MINIILCDDHKIVREGLKQIIHDSKQLNVVADVATGEDLFKQLRKHKPDVIILDIALPGRNGLDILKQVKALNASIQVLVLSMYPEDQFAIRMIKAGASGYLHKDSPPAMLKEAINTIASGEKYISPNIANLLVKEITTTGSGKHLHDNLSDREYEVLLLLGKGQKVSEIALALSLSIKTISTYKTRIQQKLGLKNNADTIQYLISQNLLSIPE